ncbi:MAG: DUF72 domain-containing protein, partial [Ignavibacteriae bacterium]|nr:DUF72 domain-containing protein [Ignavibacteriota bacterium]
DDVRTVCRLLDALANASKLGGLLIQFPYLFTNIKERRAYLMQLSRIFKQYRMFVEVRHNSWNNPMMYNFFQENRMHMVNVDRSQVKNHIPFLCLGWDGAAYFRLQGRNPHRHHTMNDSSESVEQAYCYSQKEIEHLFYLVQRVKSQVKKIFFFFQNEPRAHAAANALQLQFLASHKQRVLVPNNLIEAYPSLKQISAVSNTEYSLFTEKAA